MSTSLEDITKTLKVYQDAFKELTVKVKAKGWLSIYSTPSEENLVSLIINRIELDASQFREFTAMLHDIQGMDLVVHLLKSEY